MAFAGKGINRRQLLLAGAGLAAAGTASLGLPRPALARDASSSCEPLRPGGSLPRGEIEDIMQTRAEETNGVLTLSLTRKDRQFTGPDGHDFLPAFAPAHKFFFQSLENGQAFMNAEFTFLAEERDAVTGAIVDSPLEMMALHQHYIGEQPQTFHYHFRGRGKPTDVAKWAMKVVHATATPLPQHPPSSIDTPLPVEEMAQIIGGKANKAEGGVVEVAVPRSERFVEAGVLLKPQMNVLHKIAFEPLDGDGKQANCGADWAMLASEVNPTLEKARAEGFDIHCLYNQQTRIDPNLFFSHTLQAGAPLELAHKVRHVLDRLAQASRAAPDCPQPASG